MSEQTFKRLIDLKLELARRVHTAGPFEARTLRATFAGRTSSTVFQHAATGIKAAELQLRTTLLRSELSYDGEPWNPVFAFALDSWATTYFIIQWIAFEPYRARLQWRMDIVATASGRTVYSKDLEAEVRHKLSASQRGFLFYPHLRLPGALGATNWAWIGGVFKPDLAESFLARSADDLRSNLPAVAKTQAFLDALVPPAAVPVPAVPTGDAPFIEVLSAHDGDTIPAASLDFQGRVTADSATLVQVFANDRPIPLLAQDQQQASVRDIAGLGDSLVNAGAGGMPDLVRLNVFNTRVPLSAGLNTIRVVATDAQGRRSEKLLRITGSQRAGTTYVLAIGIGDYQDKGIPDLQYTEADARAVYDFFASEHSPARPENVSLLVGTDATRDNIIDAIQTRLINKAVYAEDTVILYFAGHGGQGSKAGTGAEEFYLFTQNVRLSSPALTGLRFNDLQEMWRTVRATTKIFINDACHAGGMARLRTTSVAQMGGSGSVNIMASGPNQTSMECEDLGHGLFTHFLVKGLSGEADGTLGSAPDGKVSVPELKQYLDREVPAEAARRNHTQEPTASFEGTREQEIYLSK